VHSASRFYDALVKIPNYHELPITVAAQRVQRSANGNAYAEHEPEARVLASSLTGNSPAAFSCSIRPDHYPAQTEEADGLVPRARVVRDELTANFAGLQVGGYQPGGVDSGHVDGSAHYDGRALDVFFRDYGNPQVRPAGWVVAHWLVANADRLGVATVIYDDHIWTARRSTSGWRPYTPPDSLPTTRRFVTSTTYTSTWCEAPSASRLARTPALSPRRRSAVVGQSWFAGL
jgi:hypothetical protein